MSKILYLHMVCCWHNNSVQQWAGCWSGCSTGCWTGSGTRLRGSRFGLGVLHGNWLQYFWSTHFSITSSQGVELAIEGQFLHFCFCVSSLDHGSYSFILSVEKLIIVYLITVNNSIGTAVETGMA